MKIEFILGEEREILQTILELKVPFYIEQSKVESSTITTFIFQKYASKKQLRFSAVATGGQMNYDFEEDLLYQVVAWMKDQEVSHSFIDYLKYKGM